MINDRKMVHRNLTLPLRFGVTSGVIIKWTTCVCLLILLKSATAAVAAVDQMENVDVYSPHEVFEASYLSEDNKYPFRGLMHVEHES